jgi:hypothetical protein
VQELHEKHLQNDRVALYGVFCRQETETDSMGHETLAERGYTFPCLSIDMSHPALKELGVDRFPTVLIFNRERDLVFRGDIKLVEKFMAEEL